MKQIVLALAFAGLPLAVGLAIAWAAVQPRGPSSVASTVAKPPVQAQDAGN